jgi:U4/U6.U5 tri-snRNP-associated protein 1
LQFNALLPNSCFCLESNVDFAQEQEKKAREKELAEQRAKIMDDLEEENQKSAVQYSKKDLVGMKIVHSAGKFFISIDIEIELIYFCSKLDSFNEQDQVLVLKDTYVVNRDGVNDEDDELENVMMSEMERRQKNEDAAKKKPLYDVYGDSANTETSLLPQYDEEKKKKGVVLDDQGKFVCIKTMLFHWVVI